MTGWLLDTNVISELRRPAPDKRVVEFVASQPLEALFLSAVTLAEIRFGIEMVSDAGHRADLTDWLTHKVRPMFEAVLRSRSRTLRIPAVLISQSGRVAVCGTAAEHGLLCRP